MFWDDLSGVFLFLIFKDWTIQNFWGLFSKGVVLVIEVMGLIEVGVLIEFVKVM